jgi:hypothetical protein
MSSYEWSAVQDAAVEILFPGDPGPSAVDRAGRRAGDCAGDDGVRDYPAGSFIHAPAGSSHVPQSETGCTLFVFYPEG